MENLVQFPGLGLEFTINRVAFAIGGFNVYWYGILIALGLVLGMAFAFHYAPDFGIDTDRLIDVIIIGTIMAIICARIYYVIFAPFKYESIWEMIDIRLGGIAIYGAVIGAFVFGSLACLWRKIPVLPTFDLVAMGFLIGQAVGRWGNFVNQEVFGGNTSLPWGMYSEGTRSYLAGMQAELAAQGVTVDPSLPVHPTFLYESIWCLIGLLFLWLFIKKRRFNGQIFLGYVFWYGVGRFWIEGIRTDTLMGPFGLRVSQVVALCSAAAAVILMVYGLQKVKARGSVLMVPLAVANLKKLAEAGNDFSVEELPASTAHKEFLAATAAMNRHLAEWKPQPVAAEPEKAAEEPQANEPETKEPEAEPSESKSEQAASEKSE